MGKPPNLPDVDRSNMAAMELLVSVVQDLSLARDVAGIRDIVRHAARTPRRPMPPRFARSVLVLFLLWPLTAPAQIVNDHFQSSRDSVQQQLLADHEAMLWNQGQAQDWAAAPPPSETPCSTIREGSTSARTARRS